MRPTLPESQLSKPALKAIETFHSSVVDEVKAAIGSNKVVVVGMAQNPVVKKARRILTEKGVAFRYLEYGSYFKMWKQRLAIKLWSGWPTYPQVFVDGKLIGGCAELEEFLKTEKLN